MCVCRACMYVCVSVCINVDTHPSKSLDLEGDVMLGTSVEHMIVRRLRKIPNGIHFEILYFGFFEVASKSRLTRACADNIYNVR